MDSAERAAAREQSDTYLRKATGFALLPTLALAMPFLSATTIAIAAAGCAIAAAIYKVRASQIEIPKPLIPSYQYTAPTDCRLNQQLFLGNAIAFDDYLSSLDNFVEQNNINKIDNEVKEHHMTTLEDHMAPFFIEDELLMRHVFVCGSTGLGKSELFLSTLFCNAARGGGGIILDAKGDSKMHARIQHFMKKIGRDDDMMFVNFDNPDLSHTYNPLLFGNVRQTISTTMKLNNSKEEYFRNLNRTALVAAVICLQNQDNAPAFAFSDLAVLFKDVYRFFELYESMDETKKEDREIVWLFLKRWVDENKKEGIGFDDKLYKDRLDGLATIMTDFSHSEYRRILNDYSPDIELKQAILENKVIVISMPALSDKEGSVLFGKLFIADLARAIGQIQNERKKANPPFPIFLDEYGSFKDSSHAELFQLARSAGISLWLSVQSKAFLDDEGPAFAEQILSNCWHQLYFDVQDPKSRQFAADLAGKAIRKFSTKSSSKGFGFGHKNSDSGQIRQENNSNSSSVGHRELREDLLLPEHFAMNAGDAIMVGKFGTFRMRLPILHFEDEPKNIDEIVLPYFDKPKVSGLSLMDHVLKDDKQLIEALSAVTRSRHSGEHA